VTRRAELAVDAGRRQLAEQILIKIALGVAFGQRQLVDHVDGLHQKARLLNHQLRVLHELREGGSAGR
jgi:phage shock protein A